MKLRSIKNHLELLFLPRPLRLRKPKVIQFPVIDICNSQCQMCRIWENKKSKDISLDDLEKGLSSSLFSDVRSIGFNGGEPTLRKDLSDVVKLTIEKLPSLRNISIITNAIKSEQVIKQISEIANLVESKDILFDVMVSLDGYADVHDKVRGRKGNFDSAVEVLKALRDISGVDSIRIGCTVIKENVFYLRDLLDFCITNDLYIKFRLGIPHKRLYTDELSTPYDLSFREKYEFVEFLYMLNQYYENEPLQKFFYKSLIDQIIHNEPRKAGCAWQFQGATITAKGELAYCAVKSETLMENISKGSPKEAYFSNKPHLNSIISKSCDSCNHDYMGPPAANYYRKLVLERLLGRFRIKSILYQIPFYGLVQKFREKRLFSKQKSNFLSSFSQLKAEQKSGVKTSRKVFICGWYGTETLGDKAILASIVSSIRNTQNDITCAVVSLNKYISHNTRLQMDELADTDIVSIKDALRTISSRDVLIFGGGPLMAIPSLAGIEALFEKAKRSGATTVAAAVGVGPMGRKWLNKSIFKILQLSDYRVYRDSHSKNEAERLGIDISDDIVSNDPSLNWLNGKCQSLVPVRNTGKKILLLGLRAFPHKQYAPGLSISQRALMSERYEQTVIESLKSLSISMPELVIKPLPMSTNHFGDDDRWFYRKIFRNAGFSAASLDTSLLNEELCPEQYLEHFLGADALLGMRFHSIIFGLAAGLRKKTVAIDYTLGNGKVTAVTSKYDITCTSIDKLNAHLLEDQLYAVLNKADVDSDMVAADNDLLNVFQDIFSIKS